LFVMLLAKLDDNTLTHMAANFLTLPAFAMLLRTSKRVRRMLHGAFHVRRDRMVAVARAIVPDLGEAIYETLRRPHSGYGKFSEVSTRGNVHCGMHMFIPDHKRQIHTVYFKFTSWGPKIKSVSWTESEPGNTAIKAHAMFIPETRETGYYIYNEQSGSYKHGIIACLLALNLVRI